MEHGREYVVLVSHWDDGWDVFVLDPARRGLVATARAATLAEVESAAHQALSRYLRVSSRRFRLTVLRQ